MSQPKPTAKAIFEHAHELPTAEERAAYLDEACAGDPELRRKVEALLRSHEAVAGRSFMERPAPGLLDLAGEAAGLSGEDSSSPRHVAPGQLGSTVDDEARTDPHVRRDDDTDLLAAGEGPGGRVGPYRLLEVIGEGGMGVVYLAEQEKPLRRQVALKVIRAGMASGPIVARFEAERQALTLMDHPNIAKVLDAGATDEGRPYYVMELVKAGVPLAQFCDRARLTIAERLELFVAVCEAVQHAHQKGIMHRDLKPSNVLVYLRDGRPTAKVIDFGLAKAVEQPLTDHPDLTQAGNIVGTWSYMSPEQADPGRMGVDTRTDVYSLGAVLYELLTGTVPLEGLNPRTAGVFEVLRRIKEEAPPRPSERVAGLAGRLAKVAEARRAEPARLAGMLRRELDWVALRALEKKREERYPTALDLAKDVRRYLADEPVEACPPSAWYRLGKFVRRRRGVVAAAAAIVTLLVVAVIGLAWGFVSESALRLQADQNLKLENTLRLQAEQGFERESALRQQAVVAEEVTAKALSVALSEIPTPIEGRPPLDERGKRTARNQLEQYRAFLDQMPDTHETLSRRANVRFRVAGLLALLGKKEDAEAEYRRTIQMFEALRRESPDAVKYVNELATCTFDLAHLLQELKRVTEAEEAYRRASELYMRVIKQEPKEPGHWRHLADVWNNLGALLRDRKEYPRAETALRHAVRVGESAVILKRDDPVYRVRLAAGYHNLGNVLRDQGKAGDSLAWYGQAIPLVKDFETLPPSAKVYLRNAHYDRANALGQLGRHAEAAADWQSAMGLCEDRAQLGRLRLFLATAQAELKLKAEAKPSGQQLYDAALDYARAIPAARAEDEPSLVRDCGKRGLELLRQAEGAGAFRDTQRLKQLQEEKAFRALPEGEFAAFVRGLQEPADAKGGAGKK
jgi:serine/threonine-protein kinase